MFHSKLFPILKFRENEFASSFPEIRALIEQFRVVYEAVGAEELPAIEGENIQDHLS